jgi:hypothetical protein
MVVHIHFPLYFWLIIAIPLVSGGVSYIRSGNYRTAFDYQTYYQQTYTPQRTQTLTSTGISLRQSTNPLSMQDMIKATGFDSVQCSVRERRWRVVYTNALSGAIFGDVDLSALGKCYVSNSGQPEYTLIETDRFDEIDDITGALLTTVDFVLDTPNVRQNVLSCTFELFSLSVGQPPTLFQVFNHLCDRHSRIVTPDNSTDGEYNISTSGCGHGQLWCLIDADEYKGAAIFWDFVIGLEILVLIVGFGVLYFRGRLKNEKVFTEVSQYASGMRAEFDDTDDNLMNELAEMDDQELESLLHKVHNTNGAMGDGGHMQYSQYTSSSGHELTNTDHVKAVYNDIFSKGKKRMDYTVPVDEYHGDHHADKHSIRWDAGMDRRGQERNEHVWEAEKHSHNTRSWSGLTSKPYGNDTDDEL